ncbi:uncharacterized protein HKW66_Vig0000140 [Vigna angularis]|uniref:Xylanase inhibitor C-terminal domain-containing protein n=1 Tax=Phaseolus angularis TaxID=3914 RepID=A0A8T0LB40_PHAAN|nr:uncharacterized protein HKW66_Vig0000140 [Vigna angularis]
MNKFGLDGKTINVNSSLLSIDKLGNMGTKLSTVIPYSRLHSSIYRPLVDGFVKKATLWKMKRMTSVAPFGACFSSRTVGNVSAIDMVLGGGVEWRIHGANSMVKVNKTMQCLGFVDAGLEPGSPITISVVIGGYQMEENLLEFDLASSRFGLEVIEDDKLLERGVGEEGFGLVGLRTNEIAFPRKGMMKEGPGMEAFLARAIINELEKNLQLLPAREGFEDDAEQIWEHFVEFNLVRVGLHGGEGADEKGELSVEDCA